MKARTAASAARYTASWSVAFLSAGLQTGLGAQARVEAKQARDLGGVVAVAPLVAPAILVAVSACAPAAPTTKSRIHTGSALRRASTRAGHSVGEGSVGEGSIASQEARTA